MSFRNRELPDWFRRSGGGTLINWGPASIPGWAPLWKDSGGESTRAWFRNNPYAEWYYNSLYINGSPTQEHHLAEYGKNLSYEDFIPKFNEAVDKWTPLEWISACRRAGAKYLIVTAKHHAGSCLWPTKQKNPRRQINHPDKDIIGELASQARSIGLKFGVYYSGGLDVTFNDAVITDMDWLVNAIPSTGDYAEYVDAQYRELIDLYAPDILWNDIAVPKGLDIDALLDYYYSRVPDGVVNDRFRKINAADELTEIQAIELLPDFAAKFRDTGISHIRKGANDFTCIERVMINGEIKQKWELVRGLTRSHFYNGNEGAETLINTDALIKLFIEVTGGGGNLLISIGPDGQGHIPVFARDTIAGLGDYLGLKDSIEIF